ncbi:uncharacterized protein LOC115685693 isoform X3 [Syzygium oleosum]|uniref:uncharacterized protein LOC115685693 isoform X3 n=1 Tax=Syzygium oleosum TaxID=219896 RepID=UPI0024B93953|nr:uncharacterized protein LOC115685693 isoform X3 [Syzygium oleosum]
MMIGSSKNTMSTLGKMKLGANVDDIIESTPLMSEDGSVRLGSQRSTVFEIDTLTGRLVRVYGSSDFPSTSRNDMEESRDNVLFVNDVKDLAKLNFKNEQPHLKIIRTDYSLQSFAPNSDKVSRSLSPAEIEASLLGKEDNGHPSNVSPVDSRYRLGWECGDPFTMRLSFSCPPIVVHVRTCQMYNSFSRPSQSEIGQSLSFEPNNVRLPSSDLTLHQQLKMNIMLRLQNEDAFDVILSLPAPEIHNSGVVCWLDHTAFSGDTSYIFFELSEASSIILMILLIIGWFVCYSVQVPNEQLKLLGDSNLEKPSKRKRRRKSRKGNGSLDSKEKHASSGNKGKHGNIRSDNEADHNLAKPFQMKETHASRNSCGRLVHQQLKRLQNEDAFDVILSLPAAEIHNLGVVCWVYRTDFSGDISDIFFEQSEASSIILMIFLIIGWFVCFSVQVPNEQPKLLGDSNLKKPSKKKRRRKSKKSYASLGSKDKHASSGNEGKLGNIRGANESNRNLATPSKMKETHESKNSGGLVHQRLKMDSRLRLQNEDAFDMILSLPVSEIHNSGVVCCVDHTGFSGDISHIFFERSEVSSIILMIFLIIGWFVRFSVQVPNEQPKLLENSNLKKSSKRKRRRKSKKINASLGSEEKHASSGNEGKHGNIRSANESNRNLATPSKMKETQESKSSGGGLVHQQLKMDNILRLQNEDAFDVILSLPAPEIHNLGFFCCVHTAFSGNISCIFYERSEASSIKLMIIGQFVCYSVQMPNEQLKLLGVSTLKKPSKRKRRRKSGKSNVSLNSEDKHVSSGNEGKHGYIRSNNEAGCNLATASKMMETHESRNSGGDLDRKDENVSTDNEGGLSDDEVDPNLKTLSKKKKQRKSRKKNKKKDKLVSLENDDKFGNSRSNDEGDSTLERPSKTKKAYKSRESDGNLDKKDEHVSLEKEGKIGKNRSNDEDDCSLKMPSKMKKTNKSGENDGGLDKKEEPPCLENEGRLVSSMSNEGYSNMKTLSKKDESRDNKDEHVSSENDGRLGNMSDDESDTNLKMPSKMKNLHTSMESDGSLDKKDEHSSLENEGKLGYNRSNDVADCNLKMPCKIMKAHLSGQNDGDLDKEDKHVSLENEGRLGDSRSNGGDLNLKKLSKRKKGSVSRKKNRSLDNRDDHVSSENNGRLGNTRSEDEGDPNLKMPAKMRKAHKSLESDGCLDKKDEHVSFEIEGKLGSSRINDEGHSKMKMTRWITKTLKSGCQKDGHASSENKDRLGNSRSGDEGVSSENNGRLGNTESEDEGDPNLKMPVKMRKTHKSLESDGCLDKKDDHVSSEIEGKLGSSRINDEGHSKMKMTCWIKKTLKSGCQKDGHVSAENEDRLGNSRSGDEGVSSENNARLGNTESEDEGDPNLKMPAKMRKTQKSLESDGCLDKKDKHVSSEIEGKLGSSRINDEGHSKMKMICWIKKTLKFGCQKDGHVSSENEDQLGNSRSGDSNLKTLSKSYRSLDRKVEHVSLENEGRLGESRGNDDTWMNLKKLVNGGTSGGWIGKLFVSNTEISKGSNCTILLEGFYEGRSVILKCLVWGHDYVGSLQIQALTASDRDSIITWLFGAEYDQDFVYLALELCASSLDDLIRAHSNSSEISVFPDDPASNAIIKYKMRLDLVKGMMQDVNLWREDGHPSPLLLKLMRDVVSGLVHLNCLGIIHQVLKLQNVLITKELCAKLSDTGSSKLLLRGTFSSGYHGADCGSLGLQAPEQLCTAHQTCSVDEFGLNRVSSFCITGGRHAFGGSLKGDSNIEENTMDLSLVEVMPEAADLFACLLHPDPYLRPKALEHVYLEDEGRLGNCRSDDEGNPNLKALPKRKKKGKSRKINQSLDNKDQHGSLENDDSICDSRGYDEGDPGLKMPSRMRKTHESIESDGSLDKRDKDVSSEIDGKLGTNRINAEGQSKMKAPCWIEKTHKSGKRNENLDKKDKHVSSENEDRLGNSNSGDEGDFNSKTLSKRKKRRKSGKSNGGLDRKDHHAFSENEGRLGNSVGNDDAGMNLKKPVGGVTPGCQIGKLFVSNTEIAKGSKGTIILEGFYEGRPVAVKRIVRAHHYVASQEIKSLTASDQDPNIVRLYGEENDQDFVYLALERCACSLDDLILAHSNSSEKSVFPDDPASNAIIEYKMRLDSVKGTMQDVNLWREDGHPSPLLLKLMRDVVSGLVHLHCLGIIHQGLKPRSVLITEELCAKLSDMGSSKLLSGDTSPSGYHVTDFGSPGLQALEQLCPVHQTYSDDVFGLGCILFFCVTGGRYPFGVGVKGDSIIKEYPIDLSPVEFLPEAADLFTRLLNPNPNLRPKALEVLGHPLFWNSKMRLSFFREVSDWVESRAKGTKSDLLEKLESIAQHVFDEEWHEKIDCKVIEHQCKFRAYKFKRVRDLLRIVRNTFSHYRELPPKIQEIVGSSPEDLDSYYAKRFPRLLIETYRFVSMCCEDEERSLFPEYFNW